MPSSPSYPSVIPPAWPHASILRHRATALRSFAGTIDRLLVTRIDAEALSGSRHWYVRRQLLDRNIHQLHRAADDLRDVAHQMWQCADSLERSHHMATTSWV